MEMRQNLLSYALWKHSSKMSKNIGPSIKYCVKSRSIPEQGTKSLSTKLQKRITSLSTLLALRYCWLPKNSN